MCFVSGALQHAGLEACRYHPGNRMSWTCQSHMSNCSQMQAEAPAMRIRSTFDAPMQDRPIDFHTTVTSFISTSSDKIRRPASQSRHLAVQMRLPRGCTSAAMNECSRPCSHAADKCAVESCPTCQRRSPCSRLQRLVLHCTKARALSAIIRSTRRCGLNPGYRRRTKDDGRWAMGDGRWAMGDGRRGGAGRAMQRHLIASTR
ncbi:hypothetical protein L1887_55049 [Cichorium endivia]|nr:hypothetical protein L1887_55049 [Cichorium endivia]